MMIGLETNRLTFRQWKPSDYTPLAAFYQSKIHSRFVGGPKGEEQAWRLMATYIGHYHLHGYSYLAIDDEQSGAFVGTVGLWNSTPWPEPELGYYLFPEAQGKGYGFEAASAVKKYAMEKLKLNSLVSYIDKENIPSKNLALKLGGQYDKTIDLLDFGPHDVYRYW